MAAAAATITNDNQRTAKAALNAASIASKAIKLSTTIGENDDAGTAGT